MAKCKDDGTQTEGNFNINRATSATDEQVADIMDYHEWSEEQVANGVKVRSAIGEALKVIINVVPPSPDRTVAIRKLREARMDCNSAITFDGKL